MAEAKPAAFRVPEFTDDDFRQAMLRALRLVAVMAVVAAAFVGWRLGWRSATMLLVGAAISGSGVWEWLRLMTVVMARMDAATVTETAATATETAATATETAATATGAAAKAREAAAGPAMSAPERAAAIEIEALPSAEADALPAVKTPRMTGVLLTFFLRLGLIAVVLYATLRYLEGSVLALAAGLALGAFALVVEGIRLVRAWT